MKNTFKKNLALIVMICVSLSLCSQTIQPDLQDTSKWKIVNRAAALFTENGKKAIRFNEVRDNGLMMLTGVEFSNGTIELDVKGSNKPQQSFVGVAFHGQDAKTYDAIYFRPFNFKSDDAIRRSHAVQYISMPLHDWEKLRTDFPGKYENSIKQPPGPDDWFHVKIVVNGKKVTVFVNNESQASLEVEKLSNNNNGVVGLWMGNNSAGTFANLRISPTR